MSYYRPRIEPRTTTATPPGDGGPPFHNRSGTAQSKRYWEQVEPRIGTDRRCAHEGCTTKLSIYNDETVCSVHNEDELVHFGL